MKKVLLIALFLIPGSFLMAQDQEGNYVEVMRSVLSTEKKAAIADIMTFTKEENDAFWPLYNELQQKLYDINTTRYNLIMEFAESFEKMSDEKASSIMKSYMDQELKEMKTRKSYYPKFEKIIGSKKALRYFQAENKIRVMVDFELASNIPLFEE